MATGMVFLVEMVGQKGVSVSERHDLDVSILSCNGLSSAGANPLPSVVWLCLGKSQELQLKFQSLLSRLSSVHTRQELGDLGMKGMRDLVCIVELLTKSEDLDSGEVVLCQCTIIVTLALSRRVKTVRSLLHEPDTRCVLLTT
jgi:hypothetical protein